MISKLSDYEFVPDRGDVTLSKSFRPTSPTSAALCRHVFIVDHFQHFVRILLFLFSSAFFRRLFGTFVCRQFERVEMTFAKILDEEHGEGSEFCWDTTWWRDDSTTFLASLT